MLASFGERWKLVGLVWGYDRVDIHQCSLVNLEMLHGSSKGPLSECSHWILVVIIKFRGLTFQAKVVLVSGRSTPGQILHVSFLYQGIIKVTLRHFFNNSGLGALVAPVICSDYATVSFPTTLGQSLTRPRRRLSRILRHPPAVTTPQYLTSSTNPSPT